MNQKFVHLHVHSHYSLLDGLSKIQGLVKTAKADGMTALALTDHGAMYGAIEFFQECKKYDIKPIVGVEAYVAIRTRHDKEPGTDNKRYHLTLLAKNQTGYKNLMKLVSLAYTEGYYYKPRMDREILEKYHEGIICLSGCPGGELANALFAGNMERAREIITAYINIFGKENYFLEVMKHDEIEGYDKVIEGIKQLSKEFDLPIVGTWDSHYLHREDWEAQETLIAINTGSDLDNNKLSMKSGNYSFIDSETAYKTFESIPGAYENTQKVADMIDMEIELGNLYFPYYPIPEGTTADSELRKMTYEGFEKIGVAKTEEAIKRVEYELDIIKLKGYPSYFLVVGDLMQFARDNHIFTNTRGSAAGSFVSYLCGITTVNPLEYNLPFERFLNPDRPSAPDIDMDIADNRRDELIEYARVKYGNENVAQIGTFGTMAARGAVRDVARAMGYPYSVGDKISKLIPMGSQGFPMTIDHALEITPELKEMYDNERDTKTVIDMAKKIEGNVRHISVHAAGVVISPRPLVEFTPVQFDPKGGKLITQYDMYCIEDAGLPKFDFLGIRNLSFLAESVSLVKQVYGIDVDIQRIPMDDPKTFGMLARGETEGVFQLNGGGMTQKLIKLKPTTIHDINLMVALYRPGPMQTIEEYIDRKQGRKPITFYHPKMESYLKTSLGLLVYQDDLLFTAITLAGYDWGEVDKFRKAVGKKIPEEMAKQHIKFVEGCQKYSAMTEAEAEFIWTLFEPFQGYGFNKAHAASYGRVSYQTAYMKANYTVAYMTAMLSAESGDVDTIGIYVNECKRMNINVLPPHVNESFGGFTIVKEKEKTIEESRMIRFGLYTIKNLGTDISDAIVAERKRGGVFTSIGDFLDRIHHKNLNKKSLEALIKSGSFEGLASQGTLMANLEKMLEYQREHSKNAGSQDSLFASAGIELPALSLAPALEIGMKERLAWEKELLGLYISGHPLQMHRDKLAKCTSIREVLQTGRKDSIVKVCGAIEGLRKVMTKKGEQMAFAKLTDMSGTIEVVLFPKKWNDCNKFFTDDNLVVIAGRISLRENEKSVMVEAIKPLENE
ncbi:MAG: DNA polymerase III subunit alpha [bacterium]